MLGFGWDIARWETEGRWAFVDASPHPEDEVVVTGEYDMGALLARVEYAVQSVRAERLAMDSLGAVFARLGDSPLVRRELFRIVSVLKRLGTTAMATSPVTASRSSWPTTW
jgi:circadian clock protein KaiC